jgi:hypothetical protein
MLSALAFPRPCSQLRVERRTCGRTCTCSAMFQPILVLVRSRTSALYGSAELGHETAHMSLLLLKPDAMNDQLQDVTLNMMDSVTST